MSKTKLEQITTNLGGNIRYGTLLGRRHIIAPMVMMAPGVWAGSDGPLLYTPKHLANSCPSWNNKPVVIRHPKKGGRPVSAGDPDILNEVEVGRVLNARYDSKQRAEAWLDEERLQEVAPDIHDRILRRDIIEVSTGLFVQQKTKNGTFNGKEYSFVASNHRPDHLAILPDEEGACSVKDGAGLLQTNRKGRNMAMNKRVVVEEIISNSGSWDEEDRDFLLALNERQLGKILDPLINGVAEVEEELEDEELDEVDDVELEFDEDEDEDEDEDLDAEYEDEDEDEDPPEVNARGGKKKKKIGKATDQSTGGAPMFKKGTGAGAPKGGVPSICSRGATYNQVRNTLPQEMREVFDIGLQTVNAKRDGLIDIIVNNPGNRFGKRQLRGFEIAELEALAGLAMGGAPTTANNARYAPDYSGAAGGAFIANSNEKGEDNFMPTINFQKRDDDE